VSGAAGQWLALSADFKRYGIDLRDVTKYDNSGGCKFDKVDNSRLDSLFSLELCQRTVANYCANWRERVNDDLAIWGNVHTMAFPGPAFCCLMQGDLDSFETYTQMHREFVDTPAEDLELGFTRGLSGGVIGVALGLACNKKLCVDMLKAGHYEYLGKGMIPQGIADDPVLPHFPIDTRGEVVWMLNLCSIASGEHSVPLDEVFVPLPHQLHPPAIEGDDNTLKHAEAFETGGGVGGGMYPGAKMIADSFLTIPLIAAEACIVLKRFDQAMEHVDMYERDCWNSGRASFTPWYRLRILGMRAVANEGAVSAALAPQLLQHMEECIVEATAWGAKLLVVLALKDCIALLAGTIASSDLQSLESRYEEACFELSYEKESPLKARIDNKQLHGPVIDR